MRRLLVVASFLVFLAGFQLSILTEQTEHYFAWTIQPPLTAAFLGAGYWSSFLLEFLSSRQRTWVRARIAVPAVFSFATLTLVATLLHFDRFHFASPEPIAQAAAWFWLAIYLVVPPTMLVMWMRQIRVPGGDPPRQSMLPFSIRLILALQSVFMLVIGVTLFIQPSFAPLLWPWKLTPLPARAVGAWLVGVGIFAGHAVWENDFSRVKAGMASYLAFGALQLLAIERFPSTPDLNQPIAWIYLLLTISVLATALYSIAARRSR